MKTDNRTLRQVEGDYLLGCLRQLQKDFSEAAKPFVDRLVALRSLDPPTPMLINIADIPPEVLRQIQEKTNES